MLHRPLPRTLEACLRDVRSEKVSVRRSAVSELCRFVQQDPDDKQVVAAMIDALEDGDHEVRTMSAYCLGDAHIEQALPRLLVLIDDVALTVRQAALDAIGQLRDSRAASRLMRAVRDERADVRFQAVIALARVDPDAGRREARRLLHDEDRHVRYVSVRTLEELAQTRQGDVDDDELLQFEEDTVESIKQLLNDDVSTVRLAAAIVLARAGMRDGASVLVDGVNDDIAGMEPEDELEAVAMAGRLQLREAVDGLRRRAFGFRRLVTEKHAWAAKVSLAQMGDERAIRSIVREVKSRSKQKRTLAVVAAARANLLEAEPLMRKMLGHPEIIDQKILSEALESFAGPEKDHQ